MDDQNANQNIKRILVILYVVVIAFGIYQIISAIHPYDTTGKITINSSSKTAQLSISQVNHQAILVGTGSARVRLLPGTYTVAAIDGSQRTSSVVTVNKKQNQTITLNLGTSSSLRSLSDVSFNNMDALTNVGLSIEQVNAIEQYLFEYNPNASDVIVDPSTINPGPHDPNLNEPFTMTFNVSIDANTYKASISYTDTTNVTFMLSDQSGKLVFNSQTAASNVKGD